VTLVDQLLSVGARPAGQVERTPFPLVCCRKDCDAPATHTLRLRAWSQFTKPADRTPANGVEFWVMLSPCARHGPEILALSDEIVERSHLRILTALKRINRAGRYVYELDAVDINEARGA
jgi:hypothetical protein